MIPCLCSLTPSSLSATTSISTLLDNHCTSMKDLQVFHAQLIKTGLSNHTLTVSRALSFCVSPAGDISYAWRLFTRIPKPNLFAWNTMIRGFSQSSTPGKAIFLFIDMLLCSPIDPQRLTYPSVFKACSQLGLARLGAQLHGRIIKLGLHDDLFIRNTIIHMYATCGLLEDARQVFYGNVDWDVVAWNSMIMGLAKSGEIDESRRVFDEVPSKNSITWSSMISGYVRNGRFMDAMKLFAEMQEKGIEPNEFTLVSLLNACARLGALQQGQWIHDYINRNRVDLNTIVTTAIIDMYSRCGSIGKAYQVFQVAPKKGLSCWNSMILGLARNGYEEEAISLFSQLESSSHKPDEVSFLGVLTACNYAGFINLGAEYFLLMMERYHMNPTIKHYTCVVDMLGRAGFLEEAEEIIRSMLVDTDAIIWGSLLWASMKHGDADVAERAAKNMIELDPGESSAYVLMSNVYAASNEYDESVAQRLSMKAKQIEKEPGCSLIEVDGSVHEFIAGGRLHPRVQEIYCILDELKPMLQGVR